MSPEEDNELFGRLVQHIGEFFEQDMSSLTRESKLATSIEGLSSLKLVELAIYLEDCFQVEFGTNLVEQVETVGDLMAYIERLRVAAPAAVSAGSS